jgi:hypothetical protein
MTTAAPDWRRLFDGAPGRGATFTFTIPDQPALYAAAVSDSKEPRPRSRPA